MNETREDPATSIPGLVHGQLSYLQIPALDLTTSARFYERVFGWRVDPPESGFEAPGLIGQWITDRPPAPDAGPVGWIHVSDVRRTLDDAHQAGGALRESPFPDGPRVLASFADPAGNLVGIVQHGAHAVQREGPHAAAGHELAPIENRTMPACTVISPSPAISVMLIVPDAEAAIAWYREALAARELWNLGGVAGLHIADAPFFLHEINPRHPAETSPDRAGVTSVRIELFVEDPDEVVERALAAGATPGSAVVDHQAPWGTHRQGGFVDPFGHRWSVGDRSPLGSS